MRPETMRQTVGRPARFLDLEERIATLGAWIRGGKAERARAEKRSRTAGVGARAESRAIRAARERIAELDRDLAAWNEELGRLERQRDAELAATARRLNERIGRGEGDA